SPPYPPTFLTGRDHSFDAHPGIDGHIVQWRVGSYRRYRPWFRSDLRVWSKPCRPVRLRLGPRRRNRLDAIDVEKPPAGTAARFIASAIDVHVSPSAVLRRNFRSGAGA